MPPLVIVHYHLRTGGVTRVIDSISAALARRGHPHLVLCGDAGEHGGSDMVREIPGLDYATHDDPSLVGRLREAAARAFPESGPVWLFHNALLGKNPALTAAMRRLAEDAEPMILQHHDFAEDGRPENHAALAALGARYPISPRILHACVNTRDRRVLVAAGIPEDSAVTIPNPLDIPTSTDPPPSGPPLVFLPVRGIRRKNLGEVLLLAALSPPGTRYAISRAPDQPRWRPVHDRWHTLANDLALPVEFDVSDRIAPSRDAGAGFASWCAHATHFLSTSVAEGFGYTFLEAPAKKRPVFGRCPDAIAPDLPPELARSLYHRLLIPLDWVGSERLRARFEQAFTSHQVAYGRIPEPAGMERAYQALLHGDQVDFGNLPEDLQEDALHAALEQPATPEIEIEGARRPLATWLDERLREREPARPDLSASHPDTVARDLTGRAERLARAPRETPAWLPEDAVLEPFLHDFHFLRT